MNGTAAVETGIGNRFIGGVIMAKKKSGPKKKKGKRYPGGKLIPQADRGTDWLLAHRKAITGSADLPADYPLAVLRGRTDPVPVDVFDEETLRTIKTTRPWLTEHQYLAGMSFAALSWRLFGKPFAGTARMEPPTGKERDLAEIRRDRKRYEASIKAMHDNAGAKARTAVVESAVSLKFGWCLREIIDGAEITAAHRRYIGRLVAGLDALRKMPATTITEDEAEEARREAAE